MKIFEIFGGYLIQKLKHKLIYENNENSKYLKIFKNSFDYFEKIYKLLDFLNFVLFLWGSQYRTLIERVLKMRLVYYYVLKLIYLKYRLISNQMFHVL